MRQLILALVLCSGFLTTSCESLVDTRAEVRNRTCYGTAGTRGLGEAVVKKVVAAATAECWALRWTDCKTILVESNNRGCASETLAGVICTRHEESKLDKED